MAEPERELHCWKGRGEDAEERFGWGTPEWAAIYAETSATCMLPRGHDGPHEFTPDDEIMISFAHPEPGSE